MSFWKRGIVMLLTFVLFFTQTFTGYAFIEWGAQKADAAILGTAEAATADAAIFETAEAATAKAAYELVVLVVDKDLKEDGTDYDGLKDYAEGVTDMTMLDRIVRYSGDLRDNNTLTDIQILYFDKETETVTDLMRALENLYQNGSEGRDNHLVGAVFIGDIPLPVVNKNGNRYVSLYPYTDFSDKAYQYNESTDSFEINDEVSFPQPEIWHGVIRPPTNDENGKQKLAEYFDKNHLYYSGDPRFSDFDKRIFFGDLIHEEEKLNGDVYKNYLKYLKYAEDVVYMRFNKFWANELSQELTENFPIDELTTEATEFLADIQSGDSMAQIPDIYSKQIIQSSLVPYFQVVSKYISDANDMIDSTGRYDVKNLEGDILPVLITVKDEYSNYYLRSVNDALENEINEMAKTMAKRLPLLESVTLSGQAGSKNFYLTETEGNSQILKFHYSDDEGKMYINGTPAAIVDSPKECSVYLGSTKDIYFDEDLNFNPKREGVLGFYSIMTRAIRSDDFSTGLPAPTTGVNTRIVSAEEALRVNGHGQVGALIEDNPTYGVSAFIGNHLNDDNRNPLQFDHAGAVQLQTNDLIIEVNNQKVGCTFDATIGETLCYTFDDLVTAAFTRTTESMTAAEDDRMNGSLQIEFYRKGQNQVMTKTFTYRAKEENGKFGAERGNTDGAIFMMYDTASDKYKDGTGGCNLNNAGLNSNRCFPMIATVPVLDPAGSTSLGKAGDKLVFPEDIGPGQDPNEHTDTFQYPRHLYAYSEIDDLYFDACYASLPVSIYDELVSKLKDYADSGEADDPTETPDREDTHMQDILENFDSGDVYLNNITGLQILPGQEGDYVDAEITLKDFTDHYGIMDGKDNDGDGTTDFENIFNDQGDFVGREYDDEEASATYALPSNNLGEIARVFLSKSGTYTLPKEFSPIEEELRLNISVDTYEDNPEILSVVIHNEPTAYTISKQLEAMATLSLPIDNPRYVAFKDAKDKTQKVYYPNLFQTDSMISFDSNLQQLADRMALMPGANLLVNPSASPIDPLDIGGEIVRQQFILQNKQAILARLRAVVNGQLDNPLNGKNLTVAEQDKVEDALKWANLSIDDKHEYILRYYLSGREKAYADDKTLFPGESGYNVKNGYEATYLVLDGGGESFEMAFNKDSEEETDPRFDPLNFEYEDARADENGAWDEFADEADPAGGGGDRGGGAYDFVGLDKFLSEEIPDFIEGFSTVPEFNLECTDGEGTLGGTDEGDGEKNIEILTYTYLDLGTGEKDLTEPLLWELSDSMTADNESLMKAVAYIYDSEGVLDVSGNQSVRFSVESDLASAVSFLDGNIAVSENGTAEVIFKAGKKAGTLKLKAEVEGSGEANTVELFLTAGDPSKIEIDSDSFALVANGEAETAVRITLKDKFDNLAENSFEKVTVFLDEKLEIAGDSDINKSAEGIQLSTVLGVATFRVRAKTVTGNAKIFAFVDSQDLNDMIFSAGTNYDQMDFDSFVRGQKTFQIFDQVDLDFRFFDSNHNAISGKPIITADNATVLGIEVKLLHDGQIVSSYKGPINFEILTSGVLALMTPAENRMTGGFLNQANSKVRAGQRAGEGEILISLPGFVSDTAKVKVVAGPAKQISLTAVNSGAGSDPTDVLTTNKNDPVTLEARILDQFGNLVETDNSTIINFSTTEATSGMVEFSETTRSPVLNGVAYKNIQGGDKSGKVNLIAEKLLSPTDNSSLIPGLLELNVKKFLTSQNNVKYFAPRSLYVSLLGGAFGDPSVENNLAETILYSQTADDNEGEFMISEVQSISTTVADSEAKRRLVSVDGFGKVDIPTGNSIEATVINATDSFRYQKVNFTDTLNNQEIASMWITPKNATPVYLLAENALMENFSEGIFVDQISIADERIQFSAEPTGVYIRKESVLAKIDNFGRISINDNSLEVKLLNPEDGIASKYFTLAIWYQGEILATVTYKQNFGKDVTALSDDNSNTSFAPGVYIKKSFPSEKYGLVSSFTGSSTENARGIYVVDSENDIDLSQAPGFAQTSLEDAKDFSGVGFKGENKHMLLFSAGNSVGEANLPYASDVGIIYGDPLIRVEVDGTTLTDAGFSLDIGDPIYSGQEPVDKLIDFDYNGDSYPDVLLIYEDGRIRLIEKEISNSEYINRGDLLNISGGIFAVTKIDIDDDSFDDLIVGTKESCVEGEECVALFHNNNGSFERETLDLQLDGKILEADSYDMNNDDCEDLVVSDTSAAVKVFFNLKEGGECYGLDRYPAVNENFGFSVDQNVNSKDNIFVYYPGMGIAENDVAINLTLPSSTPMAETQEQADFISAGTDLSALISGSDAVASANIPNPQYPREYTFKNLPNDSALNPQSSKVMIDENGGTVSQGDKINIVLTLKTGGGTINNLMLSDLLPHAMTLLPESLTCLDDGCPDNLIWKESGTSLRSHVISGISVPSGGTRTIKYSMIVETIPEISFTLVDAPFNGDNYRDILVKPSFNPDAELTYIYSTVSNERIRYVRAAAPDETLTNDDANASSEETASDYYDEDALREQVLKMQQAQSNDTNFDGCPDSYASTSGQGTDAAAEIANTIKGASSLLRCSGGGCLPSPYNYAFGAPDGATPGLALFAAGTPNFPFFSFFYPSLGSAAFKLYAVPTLTMGFATAVCGLGAGHASSCYAFALPVKSLGICPDFVGPINDAISKAKTSYSNPDTGMTTMISDGTSQAPSDAITGDASLSDSDIPFTFSGATNIRIPGFPSVITNWMDKQTDEIFNKLLDLPDFYFIYPDMNTLISDHAVASANFDQIQSLNDLMRAFNSLPLIRIEGKEVMVKIPSISQAEIEKYKRQAYSWIEYHKNQIENIEKYWSCDSSEDRRTLCDTVQFKLTELITSVQKILSTLDRIANLPKEILSWRMLESKYATQIICYLDTIMNTIGGYIRRQQRVVESWMKAVEDVIRIFKDWKVILDVIAEYQTSCDQCKSDRFSKLGLLLNFFMVIPDPPIIPLPKWPDIVFDISQIQTGITIMWPDLIFEPQAIKLPDLPTIDLPVELIPELKIEIGSLGLDGIDLSAFELPEIIFPDFPDLPPLPVPTLPDLPRPPMIPQLPNEVAQLAKSLKIIFKILCLLKKGLIPIPEWALATEIETLTQPSVEITLPFIKHLGVQMPAIKYDYVEQIKATAKSTFEIKTDFVYQVVKQGAKAINNVTEQYVKELNQYLQMPTQIIDTAIEQAIKEAETRLEEGVEAGIEGIGDEIEGEVSLYIANLQKAIDEMPQIDYPDKYVLTATEQYLSPESEILNRSLSEIETQIAYDDYADVDGTEQIAGLRDALISYVKGANDTNELLAQAQEYDDFVNIALEKDEEVRQFASTEMLETSNNFDDADTSNENSFSFFDSTTQKNLLAVVPPVDSYVDPIREMIQSGEATQNQSDNTALPKGFWVAVVGSRTENVLKYLDEIASVKYFTADVDLDSENGDSADEDIIFSMGGDVYLKKNHSQKINYNARYSPGVIIYNPFGTNSISDYADVSDSVSGLISPTGNYQNADITWNASPDPDTAGYEILIRDALSGDADVYRYRYLVLNKPKNDQESINLMERLGISEESVLELPTPKNPSINIEINDGNYYATIYALNKTGDRSLPSNNALVTASLCSDKEAPYAVFTSTALSKDGEFYVPLYGTIQIDATESFDSAGEVKTYYLDDRPISPKFVIGPFDKRSHLGKHNYELKVDDQSGNTSTQNIIVNVYVPDITLEETFARTGVASGKTDPPSSEMPFSLLRKRYIYRVIEEALKMVPRETIMGNYKTDASGAYTITEFNLENMLQIEDSTGKVIAEVDPETGNIGILDGNYEVIIHQAEPPLTSTYIEIVDEDGNSVATLYLMSDNNIDTEIHENADFAEEDFYGVHLVDIDLNDDFELIRLPANDSAFPGATVLFYQTEHKQMAIIESSGNIILTDKRITMSQKENDHQNDPFAIELRFENDVVNDVVAEVYLSVLWGKNVVISGPNDVPLISPRNAVAMSDFTPLLYTGEQNEVGGTAANNTNNYGSAVSDYQQLHERGIVDLNVTDISAPIRRDEFVKLVLDILCIVPREESYLPYEAGQGYADITGTADFYYPYIKEASTLSLVHGYKGEIDPVTGLPLFKPENTITRAEAVKVILEALQYRNIIDLSTVSVGSPWYEQFIAAGQDLTTYLIAEQILQNNFVVTSTEALLPNEDMTYEEVLIMALRVLDIYNCFENEGEGGDGEDGGNDGDGGDLADSAVTPASLQIDDDNDGLTTDAEIMIYHTGPYDPDTDDGGVSDGDEVRNGTDPLDPEDDFEERARDEGEAGAYLVPSECNSCPCLSAVSSSADVTAGDIFNSVIMIMDDKIVPEEEDVEGYYFLWDGSSYHTILGDSKDYYILSKSKSIEIQTLE